MDGVLEPQPHGGALKRGGSGNAANFTKRRETQAEADRYADEVAAAVVDDPDADVVEVQRMLSRQVSMILKRCEVRGVVPTREEMDIVRELRAASREAAQVRSAGRHAAEATWFLAALDSRLQEVAPLLAEGPEPAARVPA